MKKLNLSLVLNIVILVAVGALYVLFFLSEKKDKDVADFSIDPNLTATSSILYIDIDSVLNKYDYYFDLQKKLEKKQKTSEAELAAKEKKYMEDAQNYQYKVERGLVTRSEAQQLQQELASQEQAFMQLRESLSMQLAEEAQVAQRQVLNAIIEYLENMKSVHKYQYVLGATFGGNVLYANDSLNISREVLSGLNAEYQKKLEGKK